MAGILESLQDFTQVPNPPDGYVYIGVDLNGNLRVLGSSGSSAFVVGPTGPTGYGLPGATGPAGTGSTPSSPYNSIQFNNNGNFDGDLNLTWNGALTIGHQGANRSFQSTYYGAYTQIGDLDHQYNGAYMTIDGEEGVLYWNSGTFSINGQEYSWPDNNGSSGYVLSNDGTGILSWIAGSTYIFQTNIYATWSALAASASLPIEQYVLISDANGTDLGAVLKTNKDGTGFDNRGTGFFLNADFQYAGTYVDLGTQYGVWYAGITSSLNNNDVVIWDNYHWQVIDITQFNGQSPDSNGAAFTMLSKSINNGYIYTNDDIDFDFPNNSILWRYDRERNNVIPNNSLGNFQWGDNAIQNFIIEDSSSNVNCLNNAGESYISGHIKGEYSTAYIPNNSAWIYVDIDGYADELYAPSNSGSIECHIKGYSAGLDSENNSGTIKVYIYDLSYVQANYNSGDIEARYYDQSNVSHYNNAGYIDYGEFENGVTMTIVLNSGIEHYKCVYSNNQNSYTWDPNINYSYCICNNDASTFTATIDITGLTTLDITPTYSYCGIIYVTSENATESINQILNCPNTFPVTIIPAYPLVLTVESTSVESASAGDIILIDNNNAILTGRSDYNLSDNIEVTCYTSGTVRQIGSLLSETPVYSIGAVPFGDGVTPGGVTSSYFSYEFGGLTLTSTIAGYTYSQSYSGSGLNDATFTGSYSNSVNAIFTVNITITEQFVNVVSPISGSFTIGETLLDNTSGATGSIFSLGNFEGNIIICLTGITGDFGTGDSLTGELSEATATLEFSTFMDLFNWTESGGSEQAGSNVPCSTYAPISLDDNIYISFADLTGHNTSDQWIYTITTQCTNPLIINNPTYEIFLGLYGSTNQLIINDVFYVFPSTQGTTSTILINDGSGNLTWTASNVGNYIFPVDQIVFGDGITPGGTSSSNLFYINNILSITSSVATFSGFSFSPGGGGVGNDITIDESQFNGTYNTSYSVSINPSGDPDVFNWSDNQGNSGSLSITGSPQELSFNTYITFANITGHVDDDYWEWSAIYVGGIAGINVGGTVILGSGEGINWNLPSTQGSTNSIIMNDGLGNLNWIGNYTITEADNGSTLSENYSTFFVNLPEEYIDVTLPSVANMVGRSLLFIKTDGNSESSLVINGPFTNSETTYSLYSSDYGSVTFICDGNIWYIIESMS